MQLSASLVNISLHERQTLHDSGLFLFGLLVLDFGEIKLLNHSFDLEAILVNYGRLLHLHGLKFEECFLDLNLHLLVDFH